MCENYNCSLSYTLFIQGCELTCYRSELLKTCHCVETNIASQDSVTYCSFSNQTQSKSYKHCIIGTGAADIDDRCDMVIWRPECPETFRSFVEFILVYTVALKSPIDFEMNPQISITSSVSCYHCSRNWDKNSLGLLRVFNRITLAVIEMMEIDIMMTSSNGSIFRVTGLLCGEFTGHRWILHTKASGAELWCFLWSAPGPTVEQTMETQMIWDATALIMTSL